MNEKRLRMISDQKLSKVIVGIIGVALLLLTQCRQPPTPEATGPTNSPISTQEQTVAAPDSLGSAPTSVVATVETPAPTPTPTEGQKAAEAAAQQYVPEYFPTKSECQRAVAEGTLAKCMYPDSIQSTTRPEWEELFPEAEFYLIRLVGYNPDSEYDVYNPVNKLVAWQNGQKYEAESFDRLLEASGIAISEENYELIAQAFALMTLKEFITEEVVFTDWEPIDVQNAGEHYDARLQAWAKLGGLEIEWYFGTGVQNSKIAVGPWVSNSSTGDFIQLLEGDGPSLTSGDYRLGEE